MEDYQYTTEAINKYYSGIDQWKVISNNNITPEDAESALGQIQGVDVVKSDSGKVLSYNFQANENVASGVEESINSNTPPNIKSFDVPANTSVDNGNKMTFTSGMSQAGNFVFTKVVPAIAAAGAGITLGKTFDKLLYSANPDFWDEHGMSTLNPSVWGDIIGTDSAGARFLNMMLGTTPDNKMQAYIDQNALAYMALYMKNKGAFTTTEEFPDTAEVDGIKLDKISFGSGITNVMHDHFDTPGTFQNYYLDGSAGRDSSNDDLYTASKLFNNNIKWFWNNSGSTKDLIICSANNTGIGITWDGSLGYADDNPDAYTINGKTVYYKKFSNYSWLPEFIPSLNNVSGRISDYAWYLFYGDLITKGIEGIGTQENAKTPDLSNATTVEEALNALKEQYPDIFEKAVTQNVVQPDGTTVTYTYVPVAMPELTPEGNPVSSISTQALPQIDPATATEPLLKLITTLIQKDPPVNPPDTGSGDAPAVVPASGSASALYAIYNPTLAQINSFGAWLWSDNFIEQIKKLFNDPMQAIIGLHKVYATPATSGSQTIKVGYLDSGVSANVVSNQYTTIDCGTVKLSEYFHNVFDYAPYTQINLYLPFIGIVSLDNADVMRASIHIVYHVDVLSGACLAEVKVTRDGAGGTLYQYTGNASVTLPISSGSYMGIVSSIASIAGGIAGTIASGGAALPMIASAAGSALNARAKVEHSGGFSGNAGAMGGKIPYLIISRPQVALAKNFQKYIGFPANYTTKLLNCSGFVKVLECHIENVNATSSELTEIESLLKEGIIV